MPLSAQILKDRIQNQVARDDEEEFYRLLTEADERLLNMGRWRWTRAAIVLVPDELRMITLPAEYGSIVGCRLSGVARGVAWQELEYMEGGPGLISIEGCDGRLIDQGTAMEPTDDDVDIEVRRYKVADTDASEVHVLARYAPRWIADECNELLCPSVAAVKQMVLSIIHEEAGDTKLSMEYQQKARLTLDEQEEAYRGTAKQIFKPSMALPLSRRSRTNFP